MSQSSVEEAWRELKQAFIDVYAPPIRWFARHPKVIIGYTLAVVALCVWSVSPWWPAWLGS